MFRRKKLYEPRDIYRRAAQQPAGLRNPVIVIPGILGSRLADPASGRVVWGGPKEGYAKQDLADEVCMIAHPIDEGRPLHELTPSCKPDGIARKMQVKQGSLSLCVGAYETILEMLGVGGYIRALENQKQKGPEYGEGSISTCFEFPYDWRLSIDQNAVTFGAFLERVVDFVGPERGGTDNVKIDIVAHSMGGLLLRYFMRYGPTLMAEDGAAPPLTWAGTERLDHTIFVGTPNGGALGSVKVLGQGLRKHPVFPPYDAALLGTLPGVYQLMTRVRHQRMSIAGVDGAFDGLYDADAWVEYGLGLASPSADERLRVLLPDVEDASTRRRIGIDHLRKCLHRAESLHKALDVPTERPPSVTAYLFAGDRKPTARLGEFTPQTGRFRELADGPGDGTVLRASVLLDERSDNDPHPRVISALDWDGVVFLPTNHMNLTKDRTFIDSALWYLLEKPRSKAERPTVL